jgi:hypothetical protein
MDRLMPAIPVVTQQAQRTYVPGLGSVIYGGQVVEAFTDGARGGRIRPAGAGSTRHLGVAITDAMAPEDVNTALGTAGTVNGRPLVNFAPFPQNVAVVSHGAEVPVVYAAAANFGDELQCAANGQVTPVTSATADARTIVGKCTAPNGVGIGAVGLMRTR